MELIKGSTVCEVWLKAANHLAARKSRDDFDVFLNVESPTVLTAEDAAVLKRVDAFLISKGGLSISTVAETIFPLQDYLRGGRKQVFEVYPKRMRAIHKDRDDRSWGCYALRFLQQRDQKGEFFNPLEKLLEKMESHGNYKAAYELNLGKAFDDDQEIFDDAISIYDAATDRKPFYGRLPCLSHVSFKIDEGKLRVNATYRSHYYVQRLLGNLIGLGRLQYFLAHEAKLSIGPLTINSTYARLDTGNQNVKGARWGVNDIKNLLQECSALYTKEAA